MREVLPGSSFQFVSACTFPVEPRVADAALQIVCYDGCCCLKCSKTTNGQRFLVFAEAAAASRHEWEPKLHYATFSAGLTSSAFAASPKVSMG